MTELPKTFDPAAIEQRWYAHWEANGLFHPDRPGAEPWTIVNPPPNVTGNLHIGHALDNTLQDILVRHARLKGKDALWVVGTDHAGIATQMVVERQMAAKGEKRTDFSRDDFVAKVWEWKAESGGNITRQLRRLGCSMDWSREQFTMDPHFSRAVLKVFVDLYDQGLLYRDKRLVNWDPGLGTAISDLEVETREVKGHFWRFRYPLADGATLPDGTDHLVVATTRPETMLADMAVAVNPADERYASVVGGFVIQPITGRRLAIVADEHADPALGSGVVKITPGHDFNDFEVGRRAGMAAGAMLNMFDAKSNVVQTADGMVPEAFIGLHRFRRDGADGARELAVAWMKDHGFLVPHLDKDGAEHDAEPRTIQTPFGDRSGVVIEPWLTDQWYVDAATLAKGPIEAVRSGAIRIVPKSWEKTFFNWMEHIQPWCVSRQLWWGHRIPAWFGAAPSIYADPASTGADASASAHFAELIVVAENENEARDSFARQYGVSPSDIVFRDRDDGQGARFGGTRREVWRDPDVLDTWFSSALWPFATLGWPEEGRSETPFVPSAVERPATSDSPGSHASTSLGTNGEGEEFAPLTPFASRATSDAPAARISTALDTNGPEEGASGSENRHTALHGRYPNDVLISGFDILFFWDARMMMQGMHFMKEVPFKTLYLHGLVRAADGAKMSKSKGNTVDPLGLIDRYGADALRFFMAAMESQGRDIKMDERRVEGYRNFATKLWNAARFAQSNGIGGSTTLEPPAATLSVNKWIVAETIATVQAIDLALAELRFDAAANAIYQFVWSRFCDWYLELIKPVLSPAEGPVPGGGTPETVRAEPVEAPSFSDPAEEEGGAGLRQAQSEPGAEAEETRAVAGWVLDQVLVLLHPFMPFITEELWHALAPRDHELIVARWPMPDARSIDPAASAEVDWLIRLVTELRAAKNELGIAPGTMLIAHARDAAPATAARIGGNEAALRRLARLEQVHLTPPPAGAALQIVIDEATYVIPLEGVIDIAAERARLAKGIAAAEKERDALAGRLGNESFVARAKPEAVEKARADHAEKAAEAERLAAALARLG